MTDHAPALLIGRILACILFVGSGYAKLMGAAAAKAYLVNVGTPQPEIAYWIAVIVELGGGLLLLVGLQTRLVALVLAVWSIATGLIGHQFWNAPAQLINFEKNLCMAGGFLAFVAAGAGRFSLDAMRSARTTRPAV